jgi:hypothetical protein
MYLSFALAYISGVPVFDLLRDFVTALTCLVISGGTESCEDNPKEKRVECGRLTGEPELIA